MFIGNYKSVMEEWELQRMNFLANKCITGDMNETEDNELGELIDKWNDDQEMLERKRQYINVAG